MNNFLIKLRSLFAILFIGQMLLASPLNATHMVGGEISYVCLGENSYEVTFTLYQNCLPGSREAIEADIPLQYAIYNGTSFYSSGAIFEYTTDIITEDIDTDCVNEVPESCLRKTVFKKVIYLPTSSESYTIVYQRCCRNPGIVNLVNSGNMGVTYFATIPSSSLACINNSPVFKNEPPQIICANFPLMYDYSATDADGDSLVYTLAPSYRGASMDAPIPSGTIITGPPFLTANYSPGFNPLYPINALPQVEIHPETGLMTFTPLTSGRYQLTVAVQEYREGVLFNTHFRDLQVIVGNCIKNTFSDIPVKSQFENTYDVVCDGYTVTFENTSSGNLENFEWHFGDGSAPSYEFEPSHTYSDTGIYEVKLIVNKGRQCSDSIVRFVRVFPYLTGEFEYTGSQCIGETLTFSDSVYNSRIELPYTVEYDFGNGDIFYGRNPSYTFPTGGDHTVKMIIRNENGCASTITKNIYIEDLKANAGNDTFVVKDYNYHLEATGGDFYEWFPKDYLVDPYSARTYVNFPDTGSYTFHVKVTSELGCVAYDTVNVIVVEQPSILLPNAFSPNGDGLNDVIYPNLIGYPKINYFRIYNRWGELVFVSYHNGVGWDGTFNGKACEIGVYYYELNVVDIFLKNHKVTGDITLIR